ncbi:MAG: HSP90 family protein [Planctomycetes bacterium]|nr:HSP90 family protein [Planctomycetota bacterium]
MCDRHAVDQHRFQIDLRGLIELLSDHLYSGPQVYIRELLQNGVDAITARRAKQPEHVGRIELEVVEVKGDLPTLIVSDNGVGLTPDEVHRFLATIGESSKRGVVPERGEFIGQFGIGLLAGFIVSQELVMVTRSIEPNSPALEWRGRPEGTYSLRELEGPVEPGTRVYLKAKEGAEEWLAPARVEELARHFGGLLSVDVVLRLPSGERRLNLDPPWRSPPGDPTEEREALIELGRETFEVDFFDAIPLRGRGLEGVAYVLPYRPTLATQGSHRVYLKGMLLSESAKNLLPPWAFFVRCLIDARRLRPTASREQLYEDEELELTRSALGTALRDYLVDLSRTDPIRWGRFLRLHSLSIRALALQDDELFDLFVERLPYETSAGRLTLGEVREMFGAVRYVPDLESFRQVQAVASAQGLCLVNAGYVYDAEILARYALRQGAEIDVQEVDPQALTQSLESPTAEESQRYAGFLAIADEVLGPHGCSAELRRFAPASLPTIYATDREAPFRRALERTQEDLEEGPWAGVLDSLAKARTAPPAQLCFNLDNPCVARLGAQSDPSLLLRAIELLYVQALLLGQHPLRQEELGLLNSGLLGLVEWGLEQAEGSRE